MIIKFDTVHICHELQAAVALRSAESNTEFQFNTDTGYTG